MSFASAAKRRAKRQHAQLAKIQQQQQVMDVPDEFLSKEHLSLATEAINCAWIANRANWEAKRQKYLEELEHGKSSSDSETIQHTEL